MADETTLRLRIEADATGLQTALSAADGDLGQFAKTADEAEKQLKETANAADDAGTKIAAAANKSAVSFKDLQSAFTVAQLKTNALLEAFDYLTRAIAAPITELLDAEQAAAMLQGTFGGLTAEMQQVATLASQLGANNAFFDDDALAQAGATLKLFGANAQAIQELLPYVNDLAIAFGVDVNDAAQLVGQALMGQTRGLARMVPEVRSANSQLEVLAALQASAARNTDIARQRTEGLGGQLALLKRQAADAAQGFGTAMLPALNAVLRVMNDNLLPVLGKMMAAFAGLSAFFGNLGKGLNLSDLTRVAGEAILNAEAQFNAVSARVEQRASKIAGQAGNLAMAGTFGGGGAAAGRAAAPAAKAPAADDGARVSRELQQAYQRTQKALQDEFVKASKAIADYYEKARATAAKLREEDAAAAERQLEFQAKFAKEAADIQDEIYKNNVQRQREAAQAFGDAMVKVVQGDVAGALSVAVSAAGKSMSSAIADDLPLLRAGFGDAVAAGVEAAVPAVGGVFARIVQAGADATVKAMQTMLDGMRGLFDQLRKYAEESARMLGTATQDLNEAQLRLAGSQGRLSERQVERGVAGQRLGGQIATTFGQPGDQGIRSAVSGTFNELLADPEIRGRLTDALRQGPEYFRGFLLKLAEEGKLSEDAARLAFAGFSQGPAGVERGNAALAQLMVGLIDIITRENERAAQTADAPKVEAATIQQGASPDRPVYVFDVRPREGFGFAPESFFFRNRGAGTSRAVAGNPLPVARPAPVSPRVAPGSGRGRLG